MTTEHSYGFVPVYRTATEDRFLLVFQSNGHWSFPKGHPEGNETPLETAHRELREESSLSDIEVFLEHVFEESYEFMDENGQMIHKTNTFFLGFLKGIATTAQEGEVTECRFVTYEESLSMPLFSDLNRILAEAHAVVSSIPRT